MSNVVVWLVGGALVGWLTGRTIGADRWPGLLLYALVGACGAVMTGWFTPPLVGMGALAAGDISVWALTAALLGAALFLAVFGLARHATPRQVS